MKTCFPARKQNGENYATLDEMMGLIGQEPHGSWLAGTNKMWHGGIHITEKSAPASVLKPETMETAVPLQCMADGDVVAWRLNQDYTKSSFLGNTIQYTTTFVLVRSVCKPDPEQENTWLEFYSLYMGLAPLSVFMKEDGEQYSPLPIWMQQAIAKGSFDTVEKPDATLKISAGDAIGFLGEDIAPASKAEISDSTFTHIEVLCTDSRMPAFINNPGNVRTGRKYIRVHPDAVLYTNSGSVFTKTSTSVSKDMHIILPVDKCNPKESEGKTYYQVGQNYWLCQDCVDVKEQYYLKELGFTALVEESTPDMSASLKEGWVKSAYHWLAKQVRPERGIQEQQMSDFYKGMIEKLDTDKDGQLSERELFVALNHPEKGVRDIVSRMIVKHESEWFGGSSHQKWTAFFQDYDMLRIDHAKKWLDDMEWMSKVEPFAAGGAVWHMHPVMFLDGIKSVSEFEITVELIEKLLGHTNPWFTGKSGGKAFANHFKNNYPDVFEFDKHSFVNLFNEQLVAYGITGAYHKAHFLSQCLHESAHFDTTLEFGSGRNYDPGQHPDAIKNGNTVVGDGPRYRGRGLIQLTWKKNYQRFSTYSGVDCVTDSELVASVMSNAIKASCWFWRNNGGIHKKYDAQGDINVLIDNEKNNVELITLAVNGGQNGLSERKSYFKAIKKEWRLE